MESEGCQPRGGLLGDMDGGRAIRFDRPLPIPSMGRLYIYLHVP